MSMLEYCLIFLKGKSVSDEEQKMQGQFESHVPYLSWCSLTEFVLSICVVFLLNSAFSVEGMEESDEMLYFIWICFQWA